MGTGEVRVCMCVCVFGWSCWGAADCMQGVGGWEGLLACTVTFITALHTSRLTHATLSTGFRPPTVACPCVGWGLHLTGITATTFIHCIQGETQVLSCMPDGRLKSTQGAGCSVHSLALQPCLHGLRNFLRRASTSSLLGPV